MINPIDWVLRRRLRRIQSRGTVSRSGDPRVRLLWIEVLKCTAVLSVFTALVVALAAYRLTVRYERLSSEPETPTTVGRPTGVENKDDEDPLEALSAEIGVSPSAIDTLVEEVRDYRDTRVEVTLSPDDQRWLSRILIGLEQLVPLQEAALERITQAREFVGTFGASLQEGFEKGDLTDRRLLKAWSAVVDTKRKNFFEDNDIKLPEQKIISVYRSSVVFREGMTKADLIRLVVYLRTLKLVVIHVSQQQELIRDFVALLPQGMLQKQLQTAYGGLVTRSHQAESYQRMLKEQAANTARSLGGSPATYDHSYLHPNDWDARVRSIEGFFAGGAFDPFVSHDPPIDVLGAVTLCENASRYVTWLAGLSPESPRPDPELPTARRGAQNLPKPIVAGPLVVEPDYAPEPESAPAPEPATPNPFVAPLFPRRK